MSANSLILSEKIGAKYTAAFLIAVTANFSDDAQFISMDGNPACILMTFEDSGQHVLMECTARTDGMHVSVRQIEASGIVWCTNTGRSDVSVDQVNVVSDFDSFVVPSDADKQAIIVAAVRAAHQMQTARPSE